MTTALSGVLLAWTAIYLTAVGFAAWALRQKTQDRGTNILGAMCGFLAVSSATLAMACWSAPGTGLLLARAGDAALLPVPILLMQYAAVERRAPLSREWLAPMHGVALIAAVGSFAGWLDSGVMTDHRLLPNTLGRVVVIGLSLGSIIAAYQVIRGMRPGKGGWLLVVAAALLAIGVTYGAVIEVAEGSGTLFVALGYALFTQLLFTSQLVRFAKRRERLLARTIELSKRSEVLKSSFRDLNARQDELVRKEQLAAIGELAAVVAHEVRNPLAVITNAVATLRRPNLSEEHRATLLGILSEESLRLNQLVGDLLHYAKPLALERQAINVREVVEKAVKVLDDHPNVVVEIREHEGCPRVLGDALLLRQAIDNVVHNAQQAMGEGGTLVIELRAASEPEGVELVFRDTGEGMDTVVRKRALDPFFTTRPSGTGLGLAIVARVVDAHGGALTIRSERGTGTEVRMFLPSAVPADQKPSRRLLPPAIEPFGDSESSRKRAS